MFGVPLLASVKMGSAFGLVAASAIGAAPTNTIPTAPDAARHRRRYEGLRRSRSLAGTAVGAADGTGASIGASARTGSRTTARYPPKNRAAMGIIELGSVPTPPRNPKSWTKIQSARQTTAPATMPTRRSRRLPLTKEVPMPTRNRTANKLTAHPCEASNDPNDRTHDESRGGWEICAIALTRTATVRGLAAGT